MKNEKILIVDDDENMRNLIRDILRMAHYDVISANNGVSGLKKLVSESPDLVLLDLRMPGMTGFEVCEKIRQDVLLKNIPVIMLSVDDKEVSQIRGLAMDADDYITKPFQPALLLAKIKSIMRRNSQFTSSSPLTRLPGNVSITKELEDRLESKEDFSAIYADLNDFKPFNDYYGFSKGDEAIRFTARVILQSVGAKGAKDDFIGHIGGDDFVIITKPEKSEEICKKIIADFDKGIKDYYDELDLKAGYIMSKSRKGEKKKFNLISITMAVVTSNLSKHKHPAEIISELTDLKSFLKLDKKSRFMIDRRA